MEGKTLYQHIKEVKETTSIEEMTALLSTSNWIAFAVTTTENGIKYHLGKFL